MIRRYCDCCKTEMTPSNTPQFGTTGSRLAAMIQRNGVKLGVEVIQTVDGVGNGGDVCKHCILDALYAMDDRPRAAEPSQKS
jgi:hypothetical protein